MYNLILSGIRSSYAENHLGDFFYSTVLTHKPALVVELGSFMGYSSLHIAAAKIVETCEFYLQDDQHRNQSVDKSFRGFSQYPESEFLRKALSVSHRSSVPA